MQNSERLVPIGEAARLLGVSVPTLRVWDRAGRLRALRMPGSGRRVYPQADIRRFLEDLAPPPAEPVRAESDAE